ncbi:two-component system, cell cycle sensor histidine kinase and response regulator CckA [Monaibacterium marinum]|uniref:histidine kinase n=1 Tax=Pontivivens marinum TaxID=1690039 RepID=A0A2C9CQQ5_9RHOB|nr:ATP-binding protein [Monaibacterium marinum]SOH93550.1 two-component system, cell cycle sensor histidine kinase and response regulator CckA [Monaibacterium marinum]
MFDNLIDRTMLTPKSDRGIPVLGALAASAVTVAAYEVVLGNTVGVALASMVGLGAAALLASGSPSGSSKAGLSADLDGNFLYKSGTVSRTLLAAEAEPEILFYKMMKAVAHDGAVTRRVVQADGSHRLVHAMQNAHTILWQVLPDVEVESIVEPQQLSENTPFGHVRLAADRNTILGVNDWLDQRCGVVTRIDELLMDLPLRDGGTYRLQADPSLILRAMFSSDGALNLIPLGQGETAASNPDQFLMQLPISLARLDIDGTVIIANPAARGLVGGSLATGTNVSDLMEGLAQPVSARIRDVAATRRFGRPEVARLRSGDIERFLQVSLSPMMIDGEFSILMVMSDATELKTLEAQFVQSQKMQAVGQLAGGVAHDFNNLLTALSGHCDLLLLRNGPGDRDYLDLIQIQQNANRAAALVSQLLAFSRKQTLQPKVLNLPDVLGDLSHLLNRLIGEKVSLKIDLSEDLPPIRADLRQMEQVVMNLVVNARDAMKAGGKVEVRARLETLTEELRRDRALVAPGDWVVVDVSDTGTGIPEREISKIFDPFFTTKRVGEGTGLGLSTAYGIVKQTGGFLFVDSAVGEGTTFSIYIPRYVPRANDFPEPLSVVSPREPEVNLLGSGTVLLVEDEAPVRAFAARALQLRGYTVIEAASGEEALELLTDQPKVDVFISDVIMPGLDGPSWVRQAQRMYKDVEVIFVSGYAEDAFIDAHQRPVNSTFLAKPFSLNELSLQVKRSMDASRQRQSASS